jgi:hypothetical protein
MNPDADRMKEEIQREEFLPQQQEWRLSFRTHIVGFGVIVRQALVLILHDAAQPHTSIASDWKPKGLCKG